MRKERCWLISGAQAAVRVEPWSPCWKPWPRRCSSRSRSPTIIRGRPRFAKLNAAEHPDIAWAFKVVSVPTLVLFRDGVPVDDIVGAVPAQRIEDLLAKGGREGGGA